MKKFVVVIPSYKNAEWYERNLNSVLGQNYENFRVIYVDDSSPDNTGNLVQSYLELHDPQGKVKLIKNEARKGALCNLYEMIHSCEDEEIIVTVDGDDWLAHSFVLQKLNEVYSDPNVWMTWGSYVDVPQNSRGCSKPYPENVVKNRSFRTHPWCMSHLRTYYKWLFAKIKKEDLLAPDGTFFNSAWDVAKMMPMIEMCGPRGKYIHDVLYCYNNNNPISDFRVRAEEQARFDRIVRMKPKYNPL